MRPLALTFGVACSMCEAAIELQCYDVVVKSRWRNTRWICPVCQFHNWVDLQGSLAWAVPAHNVDESVIH